MVQQTRLPLEELARLPTLYHFDVSHRGERVAFYSDITGRIELHILDIATGAVTQLSHGEVPRALRSFFIWDPTDSYLVFAKDNAGDEQHDLFRIDAATGVVTRLTQDPKAEEHAADIAPDGRSILVNTNKRRAESPDTPGQMNLWLMRPDGSDLRPLTSFAAPVFGGRFSPDGSRIAFVGSEEPPATKNLDGYVMNADGTDQKRVFRVRAGSQDTVTAWHPDGTHLAVTSDAGGTHRAGILDVASGEVRWLGSEGVEEHSMRFSKTGAFLLVGRNVDAQMQLVAYETATGTARVVPLPPGIVAQAQWANDDRRIIALYSTPTARPTLGLHDLETGTTTTLVPAEYGSIDPADFVDAQHIWYESFDGLRIPALLYVPHDVPAGTKLKAMVYVHGGPTGQWTRSFDIFAQFMASRGFVVIEPNIRGSTGYGVAFRDAALRDWGGKDLEDVEYAARYLKTLPQVDPARLCVYGGSYGGFMTFIASTKKPDLWKAAVAAVGICDLHAMWDESYEHFRYFLREQMGDPEQDRALWRDRSAIEFAHQLTAKLLMTHGTNDPRCPVSQSRMFRDKLVSLGKREGVDWDYVEYTDQGHGSVDIAAKTARMGLIADWLDRALA
ncbi:MAG: S9 family peptidase [Chloroflexota bacterium]|nr:S9 family peptidase [Chloroflexota bacterium]